MYFIESPEFTALLGEIRRLQARALSGAEPTSLTVGRKQAFLLKHVFSCDSIEELDNLTVSGLKVRRSRDLDDYLAVSFEAQKT